MGRYEWTGPRPFADYANDREIDPGEVAEVDDELAADFPAFKRVDEQGESGDESGSSDEPTDGSESDDADDEAASTFDAEAVADDHWNSVVSAVEDGEYDAHLDELEAVDDRDSVQGAIADRRAALSE